MKKRLRKKLWLREFQEMGFQTAFDLAISNEDEEKERLYAFWDRLVEVVEANHLMMGGALDNFFVCTDSRRSATQTDRETLRNWLEAQPEVSNVIIGPLVDAWRGSGMAVAVRGDVPNVFAAHILTQAGIDLP